MIKEKTPQDLENRRKQLLKRLRIFQDHVFKEVDKIYAERYKNDNPSTK